MTVREPRDANNSTGWSAGRARACALLLSALGSACEGLLGGVDLAEGPPGAPAGGASGLPQLVIPTLLPPTGVTTPPSSATPEAPPLGTPLVPQPAVRDAGAAGSDPGGSEDAGAPPEPEPPRPVTVTPPAQLPLVGFTGGGPRRGTCQDGFLIGIRPTANPSTDTFGQRLVFLEPICARASLMPDGAEPGRASIGLVRDDAVLSWDATEPMLGAPNFEVPDERLLWVPQPETLCPDAAPAVVGLSGSYDPPAEDGSVTASFRSLVLECAPLALTADGSDVTALASGHLLISRPDSFAATGPAQYRSACEGGSVLSQLMIHSGFWLDGFVLGCSTLHGG